MRRTAYMLCGDWHRADDLAQTAFVALHRRWKKIRDRAATDAYVRKTLVRASIDAPLGHVMRSRMSGVPSRMSGPLLNEIHTPPRVRTATVTS